MKKKYGILLAAILVLIGGSGVFFMSCAEDSPLNPLNFNAFSLQDDMQLGAELDAQIKADQANYPMLNNAAANAYLQGIVDEILKSPEVEYETTFNYTVQIIDQDVINAFAAPGGYVYVYKGLIDYLDNEATMAAVLAHEIGHIENRHSTQRITKSYGYQYVLDILIGDSGELVQLGADILTNVALLQNSRDDEYEADESSFNYLKSTKWYPGATIYFFDKIFAEQESGDASILGDLLSTHPDPDKRVDAVEKLINDNNLPGPYEVGEDQLFTQDYVNFKNSL